MAVVTEAEDHGADPDDGADGDEQGTETIEHHREAAEAAAMPWCARLPRRPVWSTSAAMTNPLAQAAMVRATEMCILILSGAIAPTAEADSPTSAVTTSKSDVMYRPGPAAR
jgi:hypothetical protein